MRNLRGLRGTLERLTERLILSGVQIQQGEIKGLDFRAGTGHLLSGMPVEINKLGIDVDMATASAAVRLRSGRVTCSDVKSEKLSLAVAERRVVASVVGREIVWTADGQVWRVGIEEARLGEVQTVVRGMVVKVADAAVESADIARTGVIAVEVARAGMVADSPIEQFAAQLATLVAAGIRAEGNGMRAECAEVRVSEGLRIVDGRVHVPIVTVGGVCVSLDDWPQPGEQPESSSGRVVERLEQLFDVTQLDRLSGNLSVDVTVDAKLPVLGTRVATHEFRVSISDGVFNYRQLERGLSALEDSVIDFETRDDLLILERDVPVVGLRKDLVRWHLPTEQDIFLARQKSVRVRTLLHPEIVVAADSDPQADEELPVRRVSVKNLTLELSATRGDGGPAGARGAITDLEMTDLQLTGAVHAFTEEPGELVLTCESLSVQIRDLMLGAVCLEHARVIVCGTSHIKLEMVGARPRALQLRLGDIRLEDVRVRVAQPSNR